MSIMDDLKKTIDQLIGNKSGETAEDNSQEKTKSNPYLNPGETVEFESPDDQQSNKRYKVLKVITFDSGPGWETEIKGEWRIVDLKKAQVAVTIPWSVKEDHTEYPDRHFDRGPMRIEISDDETEARCYLTMENYTGFKFEGQDEPVGYEIIKLGEEN